MLNREAILLDDANDSLGEVVRAKRHWSDDSSVANQQFAAEWLLFYRLLRLRRGW